MTLQTIVIPGIGGSGPDHWQSLWQALDPSWSRIDPKDWDAPDLEDWLSALDRAVAGASRPPVLVTHSLGCLLVAHWAARAGNLALAALLVGVPDPAASVYTAAAASFVSFPRSALSCPAVVVASGDDPYATPGYSRAVAADWHADLVIAGDLGHVNAGSGLGAWPAGRALLSNLIDR